MSDWTFDDAFRPAAICDPPREDFTSDCLFVVMLRDRGMYHETRRVLVRKMPTEADAPEYIRLIRLWAQLPGDGEDLFVREYEE